MRIRYLILIFFALALITVTVAVFYQNMNKAGNSAISSKDTESSSEKTTFEVEITGIEDPDLEEINHLKFYTAKSTYNSEEMLSAITDYLGRDLEWSVERKSADQQTNGKYKGWEPYVTATNQRGDRVEGTNGAMFCLLADSEVEEANAVDYIKKFQNELHIGLWQDEKPLLEIVKKENGNITEYRLEGAIDGYPLNEDISNNWEQLDEDGVKYPGLFTTIFVFEKETLHSIQGLWSCNMMKGSKIKYEYQDVKDIKSCIYDSIYNPNDSAQKYDFKEYHIAYSRGITEDGNYVFSPWLLLKGEISYYDNTEKEWQRFENSYVGINLNTREAVNYLQSEYMDDLFR